MPKKTATTSKAGRRVAARSIVAPDLDLLPAFLTVYQFMAATGLGRTKCYELVRTGEIPTRRFGRSVRIPKSALNQDAA